ncbi:MAG: ATP-binding cassette domain-containing protein [Synergistaceae bacterium]|nr:ATP-binding cassette domain-containing protein [Synergistaceae bacterium]
MSIEVENITYVYNPGTPAEHTALKGVSLSVVRGKWISIVGHTGSGKSTLAQHLNLLMSPVSGSVSIDGVKSEPGAKNARELRRKVGLVFQYPESQFFAETVRDEIEFAPSNWGVAGKELAACVNEAVEFAGLDPALLDANPFSMSGGQRRRAAIASVLAMKPDYLVLDEPTAGLDAEGIRALTRMLNGVKAMGMGVVQVTHDLESALVNSDEILVLERGAVAAAGCPEEIAEYLAEHCVRGLVMPPLARFALGLRKRGISVALTCDLSGIMRAVEAARRDAG